MKLEDQRMTIVMKGPAREREREREGKAEHLHFEVWREGRETLKTQKRHNDEDTRRT